MKVIEQYPETEVIEKILAGDIALYEIIIRRHNSSLYKIGRSYNFNHQDTQDLMQDTYVSAFNNLSKFEKRASFKTWIIKIMLNHCYKKQQKWSFSNIDVKEISDTSVPIYSNNHFTNADKMALNKELSLVIEKALQQVTFDYRMVFTLREINGLNVAETAESLGISEANVKVRLNRAKSLLRKEVEKSYSVEDIFEFNLVYCDAIVEDVMKKLNKQIEFK